MYTCITNPIKAVIFLLLIGILYNKVMEPTNRYPYRRKLVITVRSFPLLMVWPWIGRPRCTPSNNEIVFILVYLQWILLLSKPPLAEDKPLHPLLRLVSTKNTASMMRSISKDYISKSLIDKQNITLIQISLIILVLSNM